MSEKLKALMSKTAAVQDEVDLNKVAEDIYVQGRILGRGIIDEMNGVEKEAGAKDFLARMGRGAQNAGSAIKKSVVSGAAKVDKGIQNLGGKVHGGLRKATGSKAGQKVGLGGFKGGDAHKAKTKRLYGWGTAGVAGAGAMGAGAAIKNKMDD